MNKRETMSAVTIKLKAAVAFGPGQPLQLVDIVAPPKAGEVRIRRSSDAQR